MELKGKKILVTGADGFIGSHLVEELVAQGCVVRALALYNSFNNRGWLEDLPTLSKVEVLCGDIRDASLCRKICEDIEVVFNLAALIAIPYSYEAPDSYVDVNIRGVMNMLQAARDADVQRFVQTSTSEVYGTARYVPIDEEHPLQPQSPYSASKIGADAMAVSFHNAFGMSVVIARPFNTYGPRQSARAVIPTIITQIAAGAKSVKLGDVTPTRDFNYVTDTCLGLMLLAACDEAAGQTVNIGSNCEISIKDVFEKIKRLMRSEITLGLDEQRLRPVNSEVFRQSCDNTRIKKLTGFAPQVGLDRGLAKTIEWFSRPSNLGRYKSGIYNK